MASEAAHAVFLLTKLMRRLFLFLALLKTKKETISDEELKIAKVFAVEVFKYTNDQLDKLVKDSKLYEVKYER